MINNVLLGILMSGYALVWFIMNWLGCIGYNGRFDDPIFLVDFRIFDNRFSLKHSKSNPQGDEDNILHKVGCSSLSVGAGKWEKVVAFSR